MNVDDLKKIMRHKHKDYKMTVAILIQRLKENRMTLPEATIELEKLSQVFTGVMEKHLAPSEEG